jgi:head-tail adaptor
LVEPTEWETRLRSWAQAQLKAAQTADSDSVSGASGVRKEYALSTRFRDDVTATVVYEPARLWTNGQWDDKVQLVCPLVEKKAVSA